MKTAGTYRGVVEKDASIFRALAPAMTQDQDDRTRQIIREELAAALPHHPHHKQPSIKVASVFGAGLIDGFSDELLKIKKAQVSMNSVATKPTVPSSLRSPRTSTSSPTKIPNYTNINQASTPGPAQSTQPTLTAPPVMG